MNTKLIMSISAAMMAVLGAGLIFMPHDLAQFVGVDSNDVTRIIFQVLGSLYFAFAMLNWMSKGNLIGGIYGRPIAIGNFTHFFVGGLGLIKAAIAFTSALIVGLAVVYGIFAGLFGLILLTHPGKIADK